MRHQGYVPSYGSLLGKARAGIATHNRAYRSFFGFGSPKCFDCDEPWGKHGCPDHAGKMLVYVQVTTEKDRAEDLQHNRHWFTTAEYRQISATDKSRARARVNAEYERSERVWADFDTSMWQDPYPEPANPAWWYGQASTGTYEIIHQAAPTVSRQRGPETPTGFPDSIDLGALTA